MHYRDVLIQELSRNAVALEDSGAEISVIPSSLVRDLNLVSLGKINLSGIIGDPVQADLVQLHIKPAARSVTVDEYKHCSERTDNIAPSISVIFAVCDKLSGKHDLILTADVIEQLNHLNSYTVNTIVSDSGSSGPSQLNAIVTNGQDSNSADSTDHVDVTTVPTNDDVKTTNANIDVDDEKNLVTIPTVEIVLLIFPFVRHISPSPRENCDLAKRRFYVCFRAVELVEAVSLSLQHQARLGP